MLLGVVSGTIVSTRKHDLLRGAKFLLVQLEGEKNPSSLVAVDHLGAGMGDRVLLSLGSAARLACGNPEIPIDATVVGIIDSVETGTR